MRRLLALALLAVAGYAAPAFVQQNRAYDQTGNVMASLASAFSSANSLGDFIVVSAGYYNAGIAATSMSVSDSAGNTYQPLPIINSGNFGLQIFYAANSKASANTVTVSFTSGSKYPFAQILEYSGIALSAALDQSSSAAGTSTSVMAAAFTTTNANDLVFSTTYISESPSGASAGSGFTMRIAGSADADFAEDKTVSSVGSYTGPFTATGSVTSWVAYTAAFKAAPQVVVGPRPPTFF